MATVCDENKNLDEVQREWRERERERERIKIIHKYAYRGKYLQDVVRWENMLFKDRLCCCFWPLPYCFWWMMHFVIGTLKMRTSTNKTHYTFGNKLSHAKDNYVLDGDVIWKLPGFLVNWGSSTLPLEILIWPFVDLWDIFMRTRRFNKSNLYFHKHVWIHHISLYMLVKME